MIISGSGKYLPTEVLTNADLEKKVETTDEWIVTRTGIRERRIAAPEETSATMGAEAAKEALAQAGVKAEEVDLIITATVTPDATFPSTACHIQRIIGATNAAAFDLQAACSGFLFALVTAEQYLQSGIYKNILIIGTEKLSSIINWNDRSTCVLFGDGAGAALVQPSQGKSKLLSWDLGSNGNYADILYLLNGHTDGPNGEKAGQGPYYMTMAGQETFKQAVTAMTKSANKVLAASDLTTSDIRCVISHQANIRIISAIADRLNVPEERRFVNVDRYGNISAACIPVALCEARDSYPLQPGDKVLLVAFGGGLTWASAVLEW
ncbi:MAG: beta-ketoacyl-ACP synthase III [Verrucomicrobiota bacterium]